VQSPQVGLSTLVLTAWVHGGPDLLWEKPAFTRTNLSSVRVIMAIMCVSVGELQRQAVMGWISILECPLSYVSGLLWLRPIMPGIKCHTFPRTQHLWRLPGTGEPLGVAVGGWVCAELGLENKIGWGDRWRDPTRPWLPRWGE
jgi:hypothetical protein